MFLNGDLNLKNEENDVETDAKTGRFSYRVFIVMIMGFSNRGLLGAKLVCFLVGLQSVSALFKIIVSHKIP